ncbi:NAD(P)/FAD-dependent oxidoreductase [Nocardia sp. NRRL WC-3656]|uniref:flavin-containing monooxygenase n=1 Tax=Nocardia sp. NRRL WC-3656 TaxID=1463824 RepID=UPI0004C3A330|nr:NAD(P)-binding domain-containing protein [Nocardia sp. NRRL WC-3656]
MNTDSPFHSAVVIGGGQSGLAAAWALRRRGLAPIVLEAGPEPVGSWPHYYDSLTLFSPARYSSLPGMAFPGDPEHYPHRDEVVDYLRAYAKGLDAQILTATRATGVHRTGDSFTVTTDDGGELPARRVIAATGGFARPHRPALPGLDGFGGQVLHASDYREPSPFAGQRIVVVGAGNSAIQIAVELADVAEVSLATRRPINYVPQRPLGRDMHFWFTISGIDTAPVGPWLRRPPTAPVFDTGRYRAAITAARPDRRPMFTRVDGHDVVWADGSREHVDAVVLATGYLPDLDYLAPLGALDDTGHPRQRRGLSTTHPGLGFVGLEWQRSLSSASLRGVGRDATYVAKRLP